VLGIEAVQQGLDASFPHQSRRMSDDQWSRQRGTFLSILFTALLAGAFLFLIFISCGGLSLQMLAVVLVIGAIGYLHYFFWGRALDREVAGEREEQQIRDTLERDGEAD
jgi:Flp pilus assembly protein TadB